MAWSTDEKDAKILQDFPSQMNNAKNKKKLEIS